SSASRSARTPWAASAWPPAICGRPCCAPWPPASWVGSCCSWPRDTWRTTRPRASSAPARRARTCDSEFASGGPPWHRHDVLPVEAVILIGHGAVPGDCPRDLVTRLKALEGRRRATGEPPGPEERELDAQVRRWPGSPATDPYQAGLDALAARLRPLDDLRTTHPAVRFDYAWPFDLDAVARLPARPS